MMAEVYGNVEGKSIQNRTKGSVRKVIGCIFPVGSKDSAPYFAKTSGKELLKNNLKQLLQTYRGERVMLPNYGANLRRFLFQPLDQTSVEQIKNELLQTITTYEPRLDLIRLQVFRNEEEESSLGHLQVILWLRVKDEEDVVFDVTLDIS